jgi:hypothetical protein
MRIPFLIFNLNNSYFWLIVFPPICFPGGLDTDAFDNSKGKGEGLYWTEERKETIKFERRRRLRKLGKLRNTVRADREAQAVRAPA